MNELLLQVVMVMAFGAFFFGCGCLTAFIMTRNRFRKEAIKRGIAHYDEQTGKWEWASKIQINRLDSLSRPPY